MGESKLANWEGDEPPFVYLEFIVTVKGYRVNGTLKTVVELGGQYGEKEAIEWGIKALTERISVARSHQPNHHSPHRVK